MNPALVEALRSLVISRAAQVVSTRAASSSSIIPVLLMTLNPLSPQMWLIYLTFLFVTARYLLEKKNGKTQWKRAALYSLFGYLVFAIPLNFVIWKIGIKILPMLL